MTLNILYLHHPSHMPRSSREYLNKDTHLLHYGKYTQDLKSSLPLQLKQRTTVTVFWLRLQTHFCEVWRAYSSGLHLAVWVKRPALPPAFEVAAARCGIDHTMRDPGDPLLDSCMSVWGHWTFIWLWRPGISPLCLGGCCVTVTSCHLFHSFHLKTLLVGVKKEAPHSGWFHAEEAERDWTCPAGR